MPQRVISRDAKPIGAEVLDQEQLAKGLAARGKGDTCVVKAVKAIKAGGGGWFRAARGCSNVNAKPHQSR